MAIPHLDNDRFLIQHSTKADGDFAAYSAARRMTLLYPAGNSIAYSDGSEHVIHAQGIIVKKPAAGNTWAIPAADCLPLIIVNPETRSIGLLHMGWRQILGNTARVFFEEWSTLRPSSTASTHVYIGPHICARCFTLSGPKGWLRIALFYLSNKRTHLRKEGGVYRFDLESAARDQAALAGIPESNIHISKECTFENKELASCRRERYARTHANFFSVAIK